MIAPWYKQPWLWFLLSIPIASIILSSLMITLSIKQPHSVVSDDYYKEGLAINQDLSLEKKAAELGLSANCSITSNLIHCTLLQEKKQRNETGFATNQQEFSFAALPEVMIISVIHPTLPGKDATIPLSKSGVSLFTGSINGTLTGKRYIKLNPIEKNWRLQGEVYFSTQAQPSEFTLRAQGM